MRRVELRSTDSRGRLSPQEHLPAPASASLTRAGGYNCGMAGQIPDSIRGQKYISLTTFRKNGVGVATPVWFGEEDGSLYVMTLNKMGKMKRMRNNPQVKVAACTIRGKVTGSEVAATARVLPPEEHARARQAINRKYWMARLTQRWSTADAFVELRFG
ncbi:MAG TPA: PPOX class F420-dependent oxidoreductase [Terriglobales bacterium]|nr:PPOX class F420-dependent oxidoreductase [Terriglobales bacterium]